MTFFAGFIARIVTLVVVIGAVIALLATIIDEKEIEHKEEDC
jgi:hypothetical protein